MFLTTRSLNTSEIKQVAFALKLDRQTVASCATGSFATLTSDTVMRKIEGSGSPEYLQGRANPGTLFLAVERAKKWLLLPPNFAQR